MTVYVPLIAFNVSDEGQKICDGVFQWFYTKEDAKNLYPNTEIKEMVIEDSPFFA